LCLKDDTLTGQYPTVNLRLVCRGCSNSRIIATA
jgi:hypothetical protein